MKKIFLLVTISFLTVTLAFGIDEKSKTGFFGGIDIGAINFNDSITERFLKPVFLYGLRGGYQFYGSARYGVRAGIHLNMAGYSVDIPSARSSQKTKIFGLRYGIDVDYLYDFYDDSRITIGLSAGLGYEFANYFAHIKTTSTTTRPYGPSIPTDQNLNLFGGGAYLRLGLHTYYLNQQIEIGISRPFGFGGSDSSYPSYGQAKDLTSLISYANVFTSTSFYFTYTYRY